MPDTLRLVSSRFSMRITISDQKRAFFADIMFVDTLSRCNRSTNEL